MEEIIKTNSVEEQQEFEYKVSVIVPVYNVEKYLRDCLDSLLAQTIDHEQMEVLLINDGSTDNSLAICEEYAELFSCFKVFSQENAGGSAARNFGIENAKGKYIMFLDSDDTLTSGTVKSVTDFFDAKYDQVDLVTYKLLKVKNNVKFPPNNRYNYLTKTDVYDLNQYPYISQTNMNIAVKNKNNICFDVSLAHAEDQKYITEVLSGKMKIGFVENALYQYNIRDDSVSGSSSYAFYFWESVVTNYYEKLFDKYENNVPKYIQGMFLYDSNWKIRRDQFFPYHYEGIEFQNAVDKLENILKKINADTILKHPTIDYYHKFFLLKLRKSPITVYADNNSVQMLLDNKTIHQERAITIVITQLKVYNNKLKIFGHLKSPIFSFIDKPVLYIVVNGERQGIEVFESTASRYKTKLKTNKFWGFYFNLDLDKDLDINFIVEIDGFCYNTKFYFMPFTSVNIKLDFSEFTTDDGIVSVKDSIIYFRLASLESRKEVNRKKDEIVCKKAPVLYNYRLAKNESPSAKIWLYYDCKNVQKDNGYYQFMHDIKMQDGIERYFISNNDESIDLSENNNRVVKFGSNKHKKLFVNADKIITAYIENNNIYPFSNWEMELLTDILQYEIVYLQHGILHASTPWKYTPEALQIDKIVISSYFEEKNFTEKYNFEKDSIIKSGMPRFNYINRAEKPKNRILFAPSWRNYLIKPQVNNYWEPEKDKFIKSDYYFFFNQFLNSPKLEKILAENDLYLDFKIHPIFNAYLHLFEHSNEHVSFVEGTVNDEEYAAFITDFSSFVFDFAYLKRPIIFFVPDYLQFKSGMGSYRELDLPFEKSFGKLVTDLDSAIDELTHIINHGFVAETVYKERMDNFFLPMKDCCEDLYNQLMEQ